MEISYIYNGKLSTGLRVTKVPVINFSVIKIFDLAKVLSKTGKAASLYEDVTHWSWGNHTIAIAPVSGEAIVEYTSGNDYVITSIIKCGVKLLIHS